METIPSSLQISVTIGSLVFLIQQTDFIFEYMKLFLTVTKNKSLEKLLKFDYYQNSTGYSNYIQFISSRDWSHNGLMAFFCKLVSCFICLNCFLSLVFSLFLGIDLFLVYFFLSIVVFFILFKIKKYIYENT